MEKSEPITADSAEFFDAVILDHAGRTSVINDAARGRLKVLDFGCGEGALVHALRWLGYLVYGCDVNCRWPASEQQLSLINANPYRLPYEDESYDYIISTSVLEHVQNKEQVFREMHRVLKTGGMGLHLYPSKWYLPYEPHVFVPFMNYLWPHCPKWYLALWALLGVRNQFQRDKSWREVVRLNKMYEREGLSYWSNHAIRAGVTAIFGNCTFPVRTYMQHARGGAAATLGLLFGQYLGGLICNAFRMSYLEFRKGNRA